MEDASHSGTLDIPKGRICSSDHLDTDTDSRQPACLFRLAVHKKFKHFLEDLFHVVAMLLKCASGCVSAALFFLLPFHLSTFPVITTK